jgi:hypothetical protein
VSSAIVSMVRAFARLTESEDDEIALEAAKHLHVLREDWIFTANYSVLDDDPAITVEAGDAPYIPCDCEWCAGPGGDALDDALDDNLGLIFTYGVFVQ